MSDNILKLISTKKDYVPTGDAIQSAIAYLQSVFPRADNVQSKSSEDVSFVDQGANWESVTCPNCGRRIDEDWWQRAMDDASEGKFANLEIQTPCCEAQSSLDALHYEWPAGFARFVIEIRNPNAAEIDEQTLLSLERILSTKVRKIWARY